MTYRKIKNKKKKMNNFFNKVKITCKNSLIYYNFFKR